MARKRKPLEGPAIIRKYANRRLYNTAISLYITLDDVTKMVQSNEPFIVQDAKSGEDITRSILSQIIFEKESKDNSILPTSFLAQLISFYGSNLQNVLPAYLQASMDAFSQNQDSLRAQFDNEQITSSQMFEELSQQNMLMFTDAMKGRRQSSNRVKQKTSVAVDDQPRIDSTMPDEAASKEAPEEKDQLQALQEQIAAIKRQVSAVSKK